MRHDARRLESESSKSSTAAAAYKREAESESAAAHLFWTGARSRRGRQGWASRRGCAPSWGWRTPAARRPMPRPRARCRWWRWSASATSPRSWAWRRCSGCSSRAPSGARIPRRSARGASTGPPHTRLCAHAFWNGSRPGAELQTAESI